LETRGIAINERRELPTDVAPLKLYGQEINASTFAMSVMNAFLHDMDAIFELGDTMRNPAFVEGSRLQQFDLVVANPMWNQDFSDEMYRSDNWDRFERGIPPASSADWGWVQHMIASLKPTGRLAVVLDTGAVARGSGNLGANRERDIRKTFVDDDLIEAVVLLPENLFYNTTSAGIVMVLNRGKRHPGEIMLIDASELFTKGRPKNVLRDEHIAEVGELFANWQTIEQRSAVVTNQQVASNDYNVSPSRYVPGAAVDDVLPLEEAVRLLREADAERAIAGEELHKVLVELGVE
jgi:type I restriction enzyme M protein